MSNLYFASKQRWAKAVAADHNLSVSISRKCTTPHISGNQIVMPPIPDQPPTSLDVRRWEGSLWHEVCHHLHPEDWKMLLDLKIVEGDPKGDILNIVVDHNIDKHEYGIYVGRDAKADARVQWAYKQTKLATQLPPKLNQIIDSVYLLSVRSRNKWQKNVPWAAWKQLHTPIHKKYLHRLCTAENGQLVKDFEALRDDGQPNWDLTLRIWKALDVEQEFGKSPSSTAKPGEDDETSTNENGEAPGNGDGDGEQSPETAPTDTPGSSETSPGASDDPQPLYIKYESLRGDPSHIQQTNARTLHIDYSTTSIDSQPIIEDPVKEYTIAQLEKLPAIDAISPRRFIDKYLTQTEWAAEKFRAKLKIRTRCKYQSGKLTGTLQQNRLVGAAQGFIRKPFKRKTSSALRLDTAISISVDHSGSMGQEKYAQACLAALALNKCFAKLGLAVEILGFTTRDSPVHIIHKTFAQKKNTDDLIHGFLQAKKVTGANADGQILTYAHDRLMKRPEQRKLMFICSDGSPVYTLNSGGCIYTYTKKIAKEIDDSKTCELYAIGIQSQNVKGIYKHSVVYRDLSTLATDILKHINAII